MTELARARTDPAGDENTLLHSFPTTSARSSPQAEGITDAQSDCRSSRADDVARLIGTCRGRTQLVPPRFADHDAAPIYYSDDDPDGDFTRQRDTLDEELRSRVPRSSLPATQCRRPLDTVRSKSNDPQFRDGNRASDGSSFT